jgi:hypothetical protein
VKLEENLALLEEISQHYQLLAETYGMQSRCMSDFAPQVNPACRVAGQALLPGSGSAVNHAVQWRAQ